VWFLVTPRVLAGLGPEAFGFWSLLLVMGGTLATVDLGLGVAVSRYTAELASVDDRRAIGAFLVRALVLQGAVLLMLVGFGFLLRASLLDLFHVPAGWRSQALTAFELALVGFVFGILSNVLIAALQ